MSLIQTSKLDSLPVIIFRNHSLGSIDSLFAMICENVEVCQDEQIRMQTMDHIEILAVVDSVVKRY